jgi:predicted nucleic acid-binding protein
MATAQKEPLRACTPEEQAVLERLARSSSERQDRVQRARALLAVAQGQAFAPAARQAGFASNASYLRRDPLVDRALVLSMAHGISACDACYVALAEALGCVLMTADERLVRQTRGSRTKVEWLGDL